jgi:hypothetical protein
MMRLLLVFLVVVLAAGCKVSKPKGVISEGKMEKILYEYHLAQAMSVAGDSANIKGRAYVLACLRKYGVTEAEFDSSMVWYCQHMEYLQKIYQRVDERYRSELTSLGVATNDVNRYSALSTTGDTANVWNSNTFFGLSGNGFNNRIAFEVVADTSYKAGDSFMLNFNAEFLQREGQRHGIATLAVQYDNDSVASVTRHFYGSGDNSLALPAVQRVPKRVYGFIYMLSEWSDSPRYLFVSRPSLVRMHKEKTPPPEPTKDSSGSDSTKRDSLRADTARGKKPSPQPTAGEAKSLTPEDIHSRPMPKKKSN